MSSTDHNGQIAHRPDFDLCVPPRPFVLEVKNHATWLLPTARKNVINCDLKSNFCELGISYGSTRMREAIADL